MSATYEITVRSIRCEREVIIRTMTAGGEHININLPDPCPYCALEEK